MLSSNKYHINLSGLENQSAYSNSNLLLPNRKNTNTELDKLFDFYDWKLNEHRQQEAQMFNMLSQYFSNNLLKDLEYKKLRDQLRSSCQNEYQLKRELNLAEEKRVQYEAKYTELKKANVELDKKLKDLIEISSKSASETKKLSEQCEKLKQDLEQQEKENEESIECLQKTLSSEMAAKKELQSKLSSLNQKLADLEQFNDKKRKELEGEIDELRGKLKDISSEYDTLKKDYDKMKSEHDKLEGILSYVKANYNK